MNIYFYECDFFKSIYLFFIIYTHIKKYNYNSNFKNNSSIHYPL